MPAHWHHAAAVDSKTITKQLKSKIQIARMRAERAKKYPYLKTLPPKTALWMFQQGKLLLIDVDDKGTFEYLHIVGAINIPHISKVRLKFKKSTPIGVYCK